MGLLTQILGAAAGRTVGKQLGGVGGGPLGMIAGAAIPMVLRRFGPMGMIGVALGGYAIKRIAEGEAKRQAQNIPPIA